MSAPTRRRGRGPKPLPPEQLRTHCVSVRVSTAELEQLDQQRGTMQRGEWLRVAAFGRPLPTAIPELNREAWVDLARTAANLTQLTFRVNSGELPELGEVRAQLKALRAALLGARLDPP